MTPKCRILCPTFGGHIILSPTLRLLLCNKREPSYWQHPLYLYYTPFPGLCQSFPASAQDNFAKSRRRAIAAHRAGLGLSKALSEPLSLGYAEPAPLSGEPFSKLTRTTSHCALRVCRPQAAAGKFFKKRKKGLDKTGCVRYNTEAVSAVPELH